MRKFRKHVDRPCPWCNHNGLEIASYNDVVVMDCPDCEFEIELDIQDWIEQWKKDKLYRKSDPDSNE